MAPKTRAQMAKSAYREAQEVRSRARQGYVI